MKRKNYNLATPELIAKMWEVGAIAQPYRHADGRRMYKVTVPINKIKVINPLLTGTKLNSQGVIYSKDIWNALLASAERRTSYGHLDETILVLTKKGRPTRCCGLVKSFTFSDGKTITMCPAHSGRTNHVHPIFNSTRQMDLQRQQVLCGGAR